MTTSSLVEKLYADRAGKEISGGEIRFRCPFPQLHNNGDANPSCRYHPGKRVFYCDVCKSAGSESALASVLGVRYSDEPFREEKPPERIREAEYVYRDEAGQPLFKVVRFVGKSFSAYSLDVAGLEKEGEHLLSKRVPYCLPDVLGAPDPIIIVEGEKDVDNGRAFGLNCTTNPFGAGQWRDSFSEYFKDRACIVIADNDKIGADHAGRVCKSLRDAGATAIEYGPLEGYKDLSDYLEQGNDPQELKGLLARAVANYNASLGALDIGAATAFVRKDLDYLRKNGYDLQYGIKALDDFLGGLRRRTFVVVGGKTSHGKTALAIEAAEYNSQIKDKRVLYMSLENDLDIPLRLAARSLDLPVDWFIQAHKLTDTQYGTLTGALDKVKKYKNLWLVRPKSDDHIQKLCSAVRPDLIIFDYLQRYAHRTSMDKEGRLSFEFGRLANDLSDLAIKHNAAVLCLSQFARRPPDQRNRKPDLSDLKESGDIENYSNTALLLHWPWRNTLDSETPKDDYYIVVAKNTLGPCGEVQMKIQPETMKFGARL